MNSQPAAILTTPITARWTWQRISLWLLAIVIAAGVAHWWLFVRLSSMEQQLVGAWVGTRTAENGRTLQLSCELRADRTATFEIVISTDQPGQPLPQRIRLKQPKWHEREGHLSIQETLHPWARFQLLAYGIQAWLTGRTSRGFIPYTGGWGAIRDMRSNSFEMGEWHMERVNLLSIPD